MRERERGVQVCRPGETGTECDRYGETGRVRDVYMTRIVNGGAWF